jgi:hypothetical protein
MRGVSPPCSMNWRPWLTADLEQAHRSWRRQGCTWEATSPADFAVGLQPCPSAALPLPQALGRFFQKAGLPPRPRPGRLALSFRRRAVLGRVVFRRSSASRRSISRIISRILPGHRLVDVPVRPVPVRSASGLFTAIFKRKFDCFSGSTPTGKVRKQGINQTGGNRVESGA